MNGETTRVRLFTLWGLLGFAVAQPLFDLLRRNPTFLIEHESGWVEYLLLPLVTWVLPGLLLWAFVETSGRANARLGAVLFALCTAALAALLFFPLFARGLSDAQASASAIAAGLVLATARAAWQGLRRFLALSVWASFAFSVLFLLSALRPASADPEVISARPISDRSIFVIVLDELPVTNLLADFDEIDATRFPNFARFAQDAIWFRNAYTANAYTERSVPILLTGRLPQKSQRPLLEDHRPTVFTILDATHEFVVSESITRLCPPQLAMRDRLHRRERTKLLLADTGLLWLHRALPRSLLGDLPSVENRWFDYWGLRSRIFEPAERFRAWVNAIHPSEAPLLGVIHTMYPHNPYVHHPSGERYASRVEEPFLDRTHWIDDEWAAAQAWHRARLQLEHLDALFGEFLDRLHTLDLYDDAVVAIVADHGASYRPGMPFRNPVDENWIDMLAIPMFVKLPGNARGGTVDRRLISSLDFLPTIFDAAFASTRWPMHGRSFVDPDAPGRETIELLQPLADPPVRRIPGHEIGRQRESFERMKRVLAPELGSSFGPHAPLVGAALDALPIGAPLGGEIHLEPERGDEIHGSLETPWDQQGPTDLLLVADARVLAVTRTVHEHRASTSSPWIALLPPGNALASRESLRFFAIGEGGTLHPLDFAAGPPSLLDRRLGVGRAARYAVSGFHDEFRDGGELRRWTDGHGRLRVPIRSDRPAAGLRVELAGSGPDGCDLEIVVGGRSLLHERIAAGPWSTEIPLPPELQSAATEIELRSSSFVPAEHIPGSEDRRRLGVLLRGLWLMSGPVDTP